MDIKSIWGEHHKFFGSMTVNPRGQAVIPASARRELGIDAGGSFLVFKALHGRGLILIKADTVEQVLSEMSELLSQFDKLVKSYKAEALKTEKGD